LNHRSIISSQTTREAIKQFTHWTQLPWQRLSGRDPLTECAEREIPRIVWQTGPNRYVNKRFHDYHERFKSLNPEYEFRYVSAKEADEFMRDSYAGSELLSVYDGAQFGPMKADIFRYAILDAFGGVYIDISKYFPRPLDAIIGDQSRCVLSHEIHKIPDDFLISVSPRVGNFENLFVQWCIISAPKHRFLSRVMDNICQEAHRVKGNSYLNPGREILKFTATYMWTRSIWEEICTGDLEDFEVRGIDFDRQYSRIPEPYILNPLKRHYTKYSNRPILL
jgi:mannosyltransferase OCH1-like enzyme